LSNLGLSGLSAANQPSTPRMHQPRKIRYFSGLRQKESTALIGMSR
jgi:hypothetical protein